jgi:hypothetical protein
LAEPVEHRTDPMLYETENTRPISALAFLESGKVMFAEGAGLRRVDARTGKITFPSHCAIDLVRQILPLPQSRKIVALTSSTLETLEFDAHDPARLRCLAKTTVAPKLSPRATLAPDGRGHQNHIGLADPLGDSIHQGVAHPHFNAIDPNKNGPVSQHSVNGQGERLVSRRGKGKSAHFELPNFFSCAFSYGRIESTRSL